MHAPGNVRTLPMLKTKDEKMCCSTKPNEIFIVHCYYHRYKMFEERIANERSELLFL
jgi:hypothetical protein